MGGLGVAFLLVGALSFILEPGLPLRIPSLILAIVTAVLLIATMALAFCSRPPSGGAQFEKNPLRLNLVSFFFAAVVAALAIPALVIDYRSSLKPECHIPAFVFPSMFVFLPGSR